MLDALSTAANQEQNSRGVDSRTILPTTMPLLFYQSEAQPLSVPMLREQLPPPLLSLLSQAEDVTPSRKKLLKCSARSVLAKRNRAGATTEFERASGVHAYAGQAVFRSCPHLVAHPT